MGQNPEIEVAVFDAASRIEDAAERKAFIDWAFRDAPEEAQRMNAAFMAEGKAQRWFQRAEDSLTSLSSEIASSGELELADQWFETTELDDLSQSIAPRYTILRRLGGGSGGQIFLAEQLQPVQRKVAIKLLHSGLESPIFLAAFQSEQQILAAMNHPNIAAILDAGKTFSGRPFLVMEFIDGVHITKYCDARCLTLRQRLDLFLQVCSAIQYAHQKGIIHRDLKPANILIAHADSHPLPKVIDFGIANISESSADTPQPAGTPAYMSPEQAAGGTDADTLVDVYSLGVMLYELLAGTPPWSPHRLEQSASPVTHQLASLAEPALAKLADRRGLKPRDLAARLHGDLEAIVAKAIAIDRRQRYDTVDSLASDIHRHLGCFPVTARPASPRYIAGCFFTRNRLACCAIAAIALAMVLGTLISVKFSIREYQARHEAELARAKVVDLLAQASARENITRAAILLEQKQIEEADALLQQTPVSEIAPSTEAAYVFRLLGERNAMLGRWQQASECYGHLMMANRLVPAERVAKGNDFVFGMPAILEAGDVELYDTVREDLLKRLPATNDTQVAENMVKSCLLTPLTPATLHTLRPMADRLRGKSLNNEWCAFCVASFDLRDGRLQSAHDIASRGAELSRNASRRACCVIIRAMAAKALGRTDAARQDLAEASAMIKKAASRVIVEDQSAYDASQGSWAAWAIARTLHREATVRMAR